MTTTELPLAPMTAARAHLLLQAEPGCAGDVARFVAALPAVATVVQTSGPFDVIAVVVGGEDALARTLAAVRRAPGLWTVRTCRAVA